MKLKKQKQNQQLKAIDSAQIVAQKTKRHQNSVANAERNLLQRKRLAQIVVQKLKKQLNSVWQ